MARMPIKVPSRSHQGLTDIDEYTPKINYANLRLPSMEVSRSSSLVKSVKSTCKFHMNIYKPLVATRPGFNRFKFNQNRRRTSLLQLRIQPPKPNYAISNRTAREQSRGSYDMERSSHGENECNGCDAMRCDAAIFTPHQHATDHCRALGFIR